MNRTGIILAAAAALAVLALVAGLPQTVGKVSPPGPTPRPTTSGGSLTLDARLSHAFVPAGRSEVFVTADVRGAEVPGQARSAVNLALVIDRSGSMAGYKIEQARQAARQLVAQLTPEDRLTIVHYGSDVESLPGMNASPENKARMLQYLDGISDNGGTNISQALEVAAGLVDASRAQFKVNRMVLISDGQPTEGLTGSDQLIGVVRTIRARGVSLSSVGVGNDYNEQLMEAFAEVGGGAYAYLRDAAQLASIFQKDLNAAGTQVARGVTITFRVPKGAHFEEVLGYTPTVARTDAVEDTVTVALPDFAAGQNERVVARFTVEGSAVGDTLPVATVGLDYFDLLAARAARAEGGLASKITDSPELVTRSLDKDAIVFAARARSAANTQAAAEQLKQGNRDGAERLLKQNAIYFDEAAAVAGAPAVAADKASQAELKREMDDAKTADGINAYGKQARKKARQDFGLMGSTY